MFRKQACHVVVISLSKGYISKKRKMLNTIKNNGVEVEQFEDLYRIYASRLKRFIFEYVRDEEETADIIQNLFMILWQRRTSLYNNEKREAYIFTIARNLCIDSLRKQAQRFKHLDGSLSEVAFHTQMNKIALDDFRMDGMDLSLLKKEVTRILAKLPAETRKSFMLSRSRGLKYRDIAALQSVSVKTIEKRISTALCSLRTGLQTFL